MDDLYGPPLPPGYVRPDDSSEDESQSSTNQTKSLTRVIGPQRPECFSEKELKQYANCSDVSKSNMIGPVLPQSVTNDSDYEEGMLGPLPSLASEDVSHIDDAKMSIEKRAENMRNKLDNKHIPVVEAAQREEWMMVPDTRKNQLGAISRCLAPGTKKSPKVIHSLRQSEKDRQTSEELKKYNKSKRSESLLEMHKKDKKKKEKEKKSKKIERKAFDRDEIEVKKFTASQVNSVIDKAKYLNSRFGPGNKQYL